VVLNSRKVLLFCWTTSLPQVRRKRSPTSVPIEQILLLALYGFQLIYFYDQKKQEANLWRGHKNACLNIFMDVVPFYCGVRCRRSGVTALTPALLIYSLLTKSALSGYCPVPVRTSGQEGGCCLLRSCAV
jgi:hypothetical protein